MKSTPGMLLLKKREKLWECPILLFVYGINKVKSILLELHPEEGCMISRTCREILISIKILKQNKKSVIVECLPKNKWTTLDDKKIFSSLDILITSLLQTLAQDLIGDVRGFKPFWNNQCLELSKKLWLPTETDFQDSHSNSSNSSWKEMGRNSLFSIKKMDNPKEMNSQKTFYPLYTSLVVEKWVNDGTIKQKKKNKPKNSKKEYDKNDVSLLRARKIRIKPNFNQKMVLRSWEHTSRFVYNRALEDIKTNNFDKNFQKLRNKHVTSRHGNKEEVKYKNPIVEDWETKTPKDVRAGSIKDLVDAYNTAFSNLKVGNIERFSINYKKRNNDKFSIVIPSDKLELNPSRVIKTRIKDKQTTYSKKRVVKKVKPNKIRVFKSKFSMDIEVYNDKALKTIEFNNDCRIKYENGRWFLIVPTKIELKNHLTNKTCALDPGVRKFQTIYSEDQILKIEMCKQREKSLKDKIDKLTSLRAKRYISNYRSKRAIRRISKKYTDLIDDLHYKTIQLVTRNYDVIFLPKFKSQELVKGKLARITKRNMLSQKHYRFQQRLKDKIEEFPGKQLNICTEEYTSKTCTNCGVIKVNLNGNEVFNCKKCNLTIDRDINGSRNILIKNLIQRI